MSKTAAFFLLFVFFLSRAGESPAQSSAGTAFTLAYMENLNPLFNDDPVFAVQIYAENATTGTVSSPFTDYSADFTVGNEEIIEILLPAETWHAEGSEEITTKGINIVAELPIFVSAVHYRLYFREATEILPHSRLADDYLVTCYREAGIVTGPTSLVIAATEDASGITVTPQAPTLGGQPAGVPFSVTLETGEIYQIQSDGDLTGTRVQSADGKNIAVFGGTRQSVVGSCGSADNHLWEQTLPYAEWNDLYYFVPMRLSAGDVVRILAREDETTIFFGCEEITTLDAGEFYDAVLDEAAVIRGTEDIAVAQFAKSQQCAGVPLGDPTMIQLRSPELQTNRCVWRAAESAENSQSQITDHYINLILKTADAGDFVLDGAVISPVFMPFADDPSMSYAQYEVTAGDHDLSANFPFIILRFGFGDFDAYGKSGPYTQNQFLEYCCADLTTEGEFCAGNPLTFFLESDCAFTSYDWQTSDGQISSAETPIFTFFAAGSYPVTVEAVTANGFIVSELTTIEIAECEEDCTDLSPVFIVGEAEQCIGENYLLHAETEADLVSHAWFVNGSPAGENAPVLVSEPQMPGTSNVVLTAFDAAGCAYTASFIFSAIRCTEPCTGFEIVDFELPQEPLCVDSLLTFGLILTDTPAEYTWTFSDGSTPADNAPQLTFSAANNYTVSVTVTDAEGCTDTAETEFTVEECDTEQDCLTQEEEFSLTAEAGDLCAGDSLNLSFSPAANIVNVQWELSDDRVFDAFNPVVTLPDTGFLAVTLTLTDSTQCEYNFTEMYFVADCTSERICNYYFPNAFSPNDDGINDVFRAESPCRPSVWSLRIFGRWGELLFETRDYDEAWTGDLRGKSLPSEVYVWTAEYEMPNGEIRRVSGDVIILR